MLAWNMLGKRCSTGPLLDPLAMVAERDVEAAKQVELSPSPGYSASVVEEENLRERALELDPLEPNRPPAVPPKDPRKKPVEVEEPTKKKKKKDAGGPVRPERAAARLQKMAL